MAAFDLQFDPQNLTVALRVEAGAVVAPEEVLTALQASAYAAFFVHQEVLRKMLAVKSDQVKRQVIAERRDAEFRVSVAHDLMSAKLQVCGPYGGRYGAPEGALAALRARNVNAGIDDQAIRDLLAQAETDKPGQLREAVVAQGTAPEDGEDARFEALVTTANERIMCPRVNADGSADYHDFGAIPSAQPGLPLMRRIPPTPGVMGRNVLGQALVPHAGKNLPFDKCVGAVVASHDENLLVSEATGIAVMSRHGIAVEDVFRVDNVDISSGYVVFDGNVYVKSDVARHMKVESQGSITIGGFVDSASLIAKKDIQIGKGISGGTASQGGEHRAHAVSEQNVWASFAQCAELRAGDAVIVDKLVMHCKVVAGNYVRVGGENGGNSKCIGGEIEALHAMKFDFLGAANETRTQVFLRGQFGELHEKLKQTRHEIQGKQGIMRDLEKVLEKHRNKSVSTPQPELEKRIMTTLQAADMELKALDRLMLALDEQLKEQFEAARIVVTRAAYPGVEISIADKSLKLTTEVGAGSFLYTLQGIQFRPGELRVAKGKPGKTLSTLDRH